MTSTTETLSGNAQAGKRLQARSEQKQRVQMRKLEQRLHGISGGSGGCLGAEYWKI